MSLSNDIISQFVKITNDNQKTTKTETITYGEVTKKESDNKAYVVLDGTRPDQNGKKQAIPVSTTVTVAEGDRVIVMIKSHSAVITGNLGSPATSGAYVDGETGKITAVVNEAKQQATEASTKVSQFGIALADKVDTKEFTAEVAAIKNLEADSVLTQTVKANKASVETLTAENVDIKSKLETDEAAIKSLQSDKLSVKDAEAEYATITELETTDAKIDTLNTTHANFESATAEHFKTVNANITNLNTNKLDAESAKVTYANIDFSNIGKAAIEKFFSTSGMITDLVVGDSTVTGKLVGVTISGDLIEGNTVKAEKLVVKGSDGLYYKLNIEAGAATSEKVTATDLQNGLHGTAIIAKTITAEKISVNDLVAFGADIAGFHITEQNTFYSGAKSSVSNTTQGVYMDATGQVNLGDSNNFIKYYKDSSGNYRLEISANSILLGSSKKNIETTIDEVKSSVDNIEVGGRNLILDSKLNAGSTEWSIGGCEVGFDNEYAIITKDETSSRSYYNQRRSILPQVGQTYTLSIEAMRLPDVDIPSGSTIFVRFVKVDDDGTSRTLSEYFVYLTSVMSEDSWTKVVKTFTYTGEIPTYTQFTISLGQNAGGIACRHFKCELGNKATDWSPAPEDMATVKEVDFVQTIADEATERVTNAEALIAQLSDSISMLVTDGNGTSLMTQTDDGWTFSTAEIQSLVDDISEGLNTLTHEVGDVDNAVTVLQQAVDDLGKIAEYVKITTFEDEPCIELGEGDSEFKLRITNTRMIFTEGSTVLAYFTNQSFHSKKVVIEEELQQGGFVWKVRANGNLGCVWKGGNN